MYASDKMNVLYYRSELCRACDRIASTELLDQCSSLDPRED
jgi:hypothetical protein